MKPTSKLQQQIFGIGAALSMFIIFLLGVAVSFAVYKQGLQNAEAVIRNKNSTVATLIQGYFAPLRKAIEFAGEEVSASEHWHLDAAEPRQEILSMYHILQNTIPNIHFIYSGYKDGSLLINNYTPPEGYDAVQRPWYQAAIETHPLISDGVPYQEILSEEWLVSLGKTLTNEEGQIFGVVAIDASMDAVFQALAAKDQDYPTAYSYVLDTAGIALIHQDSSIRGSFHEDVFGSLPTAEIKAGNFTYEASGAQVIAHFTRLDDLGWTVITGVPRKDVLKPIKITVFSVLTIIIAAALLATWLASFLLSRNIISPLVQLQKRLQEIVNGCKEPASRHPFPRNEIGTLAETIETLTEDALFQKTVELQTKNSLLNHLSNTDQLTGIANRRMIQEALEQQVERFSQDKSAFCILLFDIDHFKKINDAHGHSAGDLVLTELAQLIQSTIRHTDLFGRWGGEEFLLICPETSLPEAQVIAEKIRARVEHHLFAEQLKITLSLGVSEFQSHKSLKEILIEVDQKMYQAKDNGRNRVEI